MEKDIEVAKKAALEQIKSMIKRENPTEIIDVCQTYNEEDSTIITRVHFMSGAILYSLTDRYIV